MDVFSNHNPRNDIIPAWLQEQCTRLCEPNSKLLNLNLNIRRLHHPHMMSALAKALNSDNARIESVNFTSSFASRGGTRRRRPQLAVDDEDDDEMYIIDTVLEPLTYRVLPNHPSLRILHLSYNRLQTIYGMEHALRNNTSLIELYLDHNVLDTECAIQVASGLQHNSTLQVLQMNSNRIGDEGGTAIARTLLLRQEYSRHNNSNHTSVSSSGIVRLGLSNNQLGLHTAKTLYEALQHNLTLKRIELEDNASMPFSLCNQIQYYVRANQVGRYLLRQQQQQHLQEQHVVTSNEGMSVTTTTTTTRDPTITTGFASSTVRLWPFVLTGLEPDMIYFFLREQPELCMYHIFDRTKIHRENASKDSFSSSGSALSRTFDPSNESCHDDTYCVMDLDK